MRNLILLRQACICLGLLTDKVPGTVKLTIPHHFLLLLTRSKRKHLYAPP